ncbi:hypothetical protein M430DRAFT_22631 [Amorphotheca resinae ATCC 22711]|jgi:hypothetical protein|uniref:Uncharacterized protein n=1 Tax=Amorphotheca resinae ATCC 22711 TaxID=857342 RepID=A0A2T3ASD0_AMORE|nr:hypothetical protein M430DRAFT_22631 [Amorphotheca resinae ATCC 22711]PSS09271.1 hypothetical protein M430DRAFT_22631 [Amorphotheca resinae ATCC 22711]
MASSHQARQDPGLITNQNMEHDWDFQGSMITEASYADDLNCDADAAADDEAVFDDSGYFSRAASEERSNKREASSSKQQPFTYAAGEASEPTSIAHSHGNVVHSYIAASAEASNGSAVDYYSLQHTGSSNPGWHSDYYQDAVADNYHGGGSPQLTYANLSSSSQVITGPSALEEWAHTPHRHESIAYHLVRSPGKKRTARR